jgi:hypothetical protein
MGNLEVQLELYLPRHAEFLLLDSGTVYCKGPWPDAPGRTLWSIEGQPIGTIKAAMSADEDGGVMFVMQNGDFYMMHEELAI